jgi:hypothetical protein
LYISSLWFDGGWEAVVVVVVVVVVVEGTKHHVELALREFEIRASLAFKDVAERSMV